MYIMIHHKREPPVLQLEKHKDSSGGHKLPQTVTNRWAQNDASGGHERSPIGEHKRSTTTRAAATNGHERSPTACGQPCELPGAAREKGIKRDE